MRIFMAWENFEVEQQRLQVVKSYMSGTVSMTDICKKYGISRKTGYKWCQRFIDNSKEGLKDLSKAPHITHHCYTEGQINRAIDFKLKHRTWGPKKVSASLKILYPQEEWPSPTRLYEIFQEYHLVTKRRFKGKVPATAPLGDLTNCNDTWAVDLKDWFLMGDGRKCEPLTITDCFSWYLIRCIYLDKHTADCVWPVFDEAFREYGLPNRVRSDNGSPFGSVGAGRLTSLSVKLIKAGVMPEWIRPGHPEENGRHERFHLTLKQDAASPPKATLDLQIQTMNQFHREYNFKRLHEALGMKTPSSHYHTSIRSWDGILRSPEYDRSEMDVRKVCPSGCIWLHQTEHYIGLTLTDKYVVLKNDVDKKLDVYQGPE